MTAITATGTKLRAPRINGHQTFGRALRSEWIKIRSLRSTWVTSAVAMGVMVVFGAATAIGYHGIPEQVDQAKYQIMSAAPFGYIIVAVLGALQPHCDPPPGPTPHGQGRGRRSLRLLPGTTVNHGDVGRHRPLPQG